MFNVKSGNFNVQFTFAHFRGIGEEVNISDVTQCALYVNGKSYIGIAACSAKDVFVKEVGRRIALKRALETARTEVELPPTVRRDIWTRYFNRHIANSLLEGSGIGFSGTLDAEYDKPKVGSDDLVNMA